MFHLWRFVNLDAICNIIQICTILQIVLPGLLVWCQNFDKPYSTPIFRPIGVSTPLILEYQPLTSPGEGKMLLGIPAPAFVEILQKAEIS
jgi:hypothetical protein